MLDKERDRIDAVKSHLAQSVGRALIRSGHTVFYRSIFDCVRDFLLDEAFDGHDRVLAKYLKPDPLILDDMGMKQLPKRSGEFLFEIIMRRHELRSTLPCDSQLWVRVFTLADERKVRSNHRSRGVFELEPRSRDHSKVKLFDVHRDLHRPFHRDDAMLSATRASCAVCRGSTHRELSPRASGSARGRS